MFEKPSCALDPYLLEYFYASNFYQIEDLYYIFLYFSSYY